ncbi:conserved protein of unknown function [Tenacibaculum sp. 190130A14a]|uniref:DUF4097 domain-containing protein n=1 Tax=Tenacibaculum polynesiense TaxID=3137857 RepID=A0ABM9PAQ5_9FLAO
MKRFIFFIGLLLSYSTLTAQKKVTEKISASNIESVFVNVKFAEKIEVKNWSRNEISVEALVNINDNQDNDTFSLKGQASNSQYEVTSDYGNLFKRYKKKTTGTSKGKKSKSYNYCDQHNDIKINYTVYVPNGIALKVKSISGDVDALSYDGKLTLDLISGNVTVKKHSKKMNLKTISGDIDLVVTDAKFKAETLTGTVYSDLDIEFNKNKRNVVGSKIYGTVKNGIASLNLKTISGNIYLRKK